MADEAVLRVIVQGDGGDGGTPDPSATPSAHSTHTAPTPVPNPSPPQRRTPAGASSAEFDPIAEAIKRRERLERKQQVDAAYQTLYPTPQAQFDPATEAQEKLDKEKRRAAIEVEYAKLVPPDPPFDPVDRARKRLEAEQQRAAIDAEYAKIAPPKPAFDPVEKAKERLEADKRRAAIDAEYAKLAPPEVEPPFDPIAEAQKRRDKERKKAQVDASYKSQFGDTGAETQLDVLLKTANRFRGTIGGLAGTIVGSVLDMASALSRAQVAARSATHQRQLLNEALSQTQQASPTTGGATTPPGGNSSTGSATSAATGAARAASAASATGTTAASGTATGATAGAATAGTGAAVGVGAGAGVATGVIGAAVVAGILAINAVLTKILQVAEDMRSRYEEYNPQIAQVQALTEIRNVMGDLRRSREIAPEMVKYIIAQSDLQQKYEDLKVRFMNRVLPIVTNIFAILETAMAAGEGVMDVVEIITAPLRAIADAASQIMGIQRDAKMEDVLDPAELLRSDPRFMMEGVGRPEDPGFVPRRP